VDKIKGRGKILKNIKRGGKVPSLKIREAKFRINQNRGGKIPSFKIGGKIQIQSK